MVFVQEIVGYRGSVLDVVDENGDVVPVDRREEIAPPVETEYPDDEATLRQYVKNGWTAKADKERRRINAKRGGDIGRQALADIQNRQNTR